MKFFIPLFLFLLASAFAPRAEAANNIGRYLGNYKLTGDRFGICPPYARVWSTEGLDGESFQMWVGEFFFRNVNAGTQTFDTDFEKGTSTSTYHDGILTFDRRWFHKIKRVNERQRIQARFSGSTLRLTSRLWGAPPTERDCTFRRLRDANDDFGGDIDNTGDGDFRASRGQD